MTSADPFIELLVKQSAQRLREMRVQIDADMAKLQFQRDYVDQALAEKQASPAHAVPGDGGPDPSKPARRVRGVRRSNKRDAIRAVMQSRPEALWMPADVRDHLANQGVETTRDAVRVALKRMLELGDVERVDGSNGFKLASRNGATNGSEPGPSENGAAGPLFTATEPQEGT